MQPFVIKKEALVSGSFWYLCRLFVLCVHSDSFESRVTMTHGTPGDVRAMVRRAAEAFKPREGGGWFYIEVDHGFPYDNIAALVEEIYALRAETQA